MFIGRVNFDDVSESDLNALIHAGVSEGLTIEYKRDLYDKTDGQRKEALKDITSFANSAGGHLIIGMKATNGIATELLGVDDDPDSLITRLESLLRDGVEPRIVGVRMRAVTLSSGGAAIVIRIPKSWNAPHRVIAHKSRHFFVRTSGGAHDANVDELRVLFALAADVQTRIRTFRSDRLALLLAGHGPVIFPAKSRLIVHLIPLSAFGQANQIVLERALEAHMKFRPIAAEGMTPRINLDGIINVRGGGECKGYTQIFRNGIVEAVLSDIVRERRSNTAWPAQDGLRHSVTFCHAGEVTGGIATVIPGYFDGLLSLDVPPPIVLSVSFQGVLGARLGVYGYDDGLHEIQPFPHPDPLPLPEVIVDDYGSQLDYQQALRPIFDTLWNAAGFAKCTYYDRNGNWNPPH